MEINSDWLPVLWQLYCAHAVIRNKDRMVSAILSRHPTKSFPFFDTYLPASESSSLSDMIFNFPDLDYQSNECMLVNSRKEFRDLLTVEVPLPDIDFKKYSLIIGKCTLGDPGYVLDEQAVHTEGDHMKLQLQYRRLDGFFPCVVTDFYFWGLYQKLPDLPLEVDLDII